MEFLRLPRGFITTVLHYTTDITIKNNKYSCEKLNKSTTRRKAKRKRQYFLNKYSVKSFKSKNKKREI